MSVVTEPPTTRTSRRAGLNRRMLRLIGWVVLGHVVVILVLSPQLYWPDRDSPEALFERGDQAMKDGKYAEAMDLYRRVMDQQPKPPPIYVKAAENHRTADRLARQAASKAAEAEKARAAQAPAATQPAGPVATQPARPATPAPATQPARPFVPPELRPR